MPKAAPRQPLLPLWISLAWREVINNKMFSLAFTLSLSLGLCGFLTLDAFKTSLSAHLDERSRGMLGADLAVSGERGLTLREQQVLREQLPPGSQRRSEMSLLSMVARGDQSRLADIKAVDRAYTFYGSIELQRQGKVGPGAGATLEDQPEAWVYPELLAQIGGQIGDHLRIGDVDFTVTDVVLKDPAAASTGFSIAPKVFIGISQLAKTALIGKGSRVFRSTLIKLPPQNTVSNDADAVAAKLKQALTASDLRIKPHRAASEEIYRALLHLSDFLGLVALVALFLAGVGGAYLCRSFLERRSKDIAILLSLGLALRSVRAVYVAQLLLLATAAALLTTGLATLLLPLVPLALGELMPTDVAPHLTLSSVGLVWGMGVGGSLLTCLPLLARLGSIKPAVLFQEGASPALEVQAKHALWWLPALGLFWTLAMVTARAWRLGSLFTGIFLGAAAVFALASLLFMRVLKPLERPRTGLALWLASLSLARHRLATLASFVALGLGALLINLIPQIRTVLEHELAHPSASSLPSLFLFDIQDEQLAPLQERLRELHTSLSFYSPLVRARLLSINDQNVEEAAAGAPPNGRLSDEDRQEMKRGYNLSYRDRLSASEELVEGRPFAGVYHEGSGQLASISLEVKFAERLGLKLGDRLRFDVQGVPVEGVVVNTRRVHWTSFQPNFFVTFQPGLLDEAPKTWVASIGSLASSDKLAVQAAIVRSFSNISMLDVSATIERMLGILTQMERALTFMASLSLAAGLAVVFAIARYQTLRRLPDITLLKALGTPFGALRLTTLLEFGLLGAAATALGAILSIGGAFLLASYIFDKQWVFNWQVPLLTTALLTLMTSAIGLIAVWRSLQVSPARLLQEAPGA